MDGRAIIALTGGWIAQSGGIPAFPTDALAGIAPRTAFVFDTTGLGHWDTGLIALLWDAERAAATGVTLG